MIGVRGWRGTRSGMALAGSRQRDVRSAIPTRRRWDMRWRGITVAGVVTAVFLILLGLTSNFLVDLVWFSAVGYLNVFWTIFGAKAVLFVVVFAGERNAGIPVRPAPRAL